MREFAKIMAAAVAMLLCGCQMVYRPRFDLSPEMVRHASGRVGDGPYVVVEIRKFSFPEFACNMISRKNYPCLEVVPGSKIMPELSRLFPRLFADTPDAVPIIVMQNVRSGAVSDIGGGTFFDSAAGFNKGLSRKNRSDMASPAPFPPYFYYNVIAHVATAGLVPFRRGTYSSHYGVSIMTGYDSYSAEVPYSAKASLWGVNALVAPFLPESSGWVHGELFSEINPDASDAQKRTALCCAIAKALAEMPPEARAELRRNPVALLRDKETEGSRTFRLVQVPPDRKISDERLGEARNRPRIVSQSYNPATRKGSVAFDPSACDDPQAAIAWVRESYIPLIAAQKERAIDASEPLDKAPPPRLSITGFKKESASLIKMDFTVLE